MSVSLLALGAAGGSGYPKMQTFTTSGTWTAPSNLVGNVVWISGAAGGGSGMWQRHSTTTTPSSITSFGGDGGESCLHKPIEVIPGNNYTVVVGSGGSARTGNFDTDFHIQGNDGGTSSFGTFTLRGGVGGGKNPGPNTSPDGVIGMAGTRIFRVALNTTGLDSNIVMYGSTCGSYSDGKPAVYNLRSIAGGGGPTHFGGGGAGSIQTNVVQNAKPNTGAGGGACIAWHSTQSTGAGGSGIIIVQWLEE